MLIKMITCVTGILFLLIAVPTHLMAEESTSANVIILNKKDIKATDAATIVELLNMMPGLNTTDSGTLSIGGFSASDIIVTLDGRPINDQTITSKYIKWSEVDFSAITRIEIHKISSRCSGGEINIYTEKKGDKTGGRLKAWRGENDHKGMDGSLNKGLNDWFFNLSHSYGTEGEHHHNNNDNETTATQLKVALEKNFSLNGSFSYSSEEEGSSIYTYNTEEKTRPASSDDYYPDPTKALYRKRRESMGGVVNFGLEDFFSEFFVNDHNKKNRATGVHKDENGDIIYEVDEDGNVTTIPYLNGNEVDVLEYGCKLGIRKKQYDYGIRAIETTADFSKTSSQGITTEGDAKEYLLDLSGGFFWREFAFSANVFFHEEYGLDIFPKIAFSKQFKPYYLDISFTATKKYPSLYQKYFSTSSTRANEDLDPQTNYCVSLKLGADYKFGKNNLSWQVAPFFNKQYGRFYTHTTFETDEDGNIVIDPDTGRNKVDYTQYENLDESYRTGGDLILRYDYNGKIGGDGRFTIDYTKDEVHDTSFSYIAPYKFKGRLFLKPVETVNLQLWYTYYSDRYADQDETYTMLWYHYMDFKATWHAGKNLDMFMEVKNLTDFDYYVYRGYPGNCRRWWLGMEFKF